jgi:23S rRNA (uracil1939-C5)-methyltransferase
MPEIPFQIGDLLDVKIEKLTYGENGIARHQGLVIFVPFSAPGDLLKVQIRQIKKNFVEAEIVEILAPGSERKNPPCPVYGKCGGCDWQHLSYEEQLKQKSDIVLDFLKKSGRTEFDYKEIVPSPREFRYRNRIQLKSDGKKIGFFAKRTHEIVKIDDCLLAEEIVAKEIEKLSSQMKSPSEKIEVLINQSGEVETILEQEDTFSEGFSQVNRFQNEMLIDTLATWIGDETFKVFYDLYAGSGNFTFPFIKKFSKTSFTAVELNEKSVVSAQNKLTAQKIPSTRCQFYLGDVELFLKRSRIQERAIVLLDPPRAGASEKTIKYLDESKALRIYYLSCNPSSLARDLKLLSSRWRLRRVQAFDMFPQTHHVEVLAELILDS